MNEYREAYKKFIEIIENDLVKITVLLNDKYIEENAKYEQACSYAYSNPAKIYLKKESSYKDSLLTLLHEYGHILDYRRYKNTKRWDTCSKKYYDDPKKEKVNLYSNKEKRAILKTEFIAEQMIRKLLKKYKFNDLYSKEEIDYESIRQLELWKYELKYGKVRSKRIRKETQDYLKGNPISFSANLLKDLNPYFGP